MILYMKEILAHAISIEGSQLALSSSMGVAPSVVTYWIKKNLPRKREEQLIKKYGRKKKKEWARPT